MALLKMFLHRGSEFPCVMWNIVQLLEGTSRSNFLLFCVNAVNSWALLNYSVPQSDFLVIWMIMNWEWRAVYEFNVSLL
jgi:hypothetical protein